MLELKKIRDKMAGIHAEATAFVEKFSAADVKPTDEEQKAQDERFNELDRLNKSLEESEKLAKYAFNKEKQVTATVVVGHKSADQIAIEEQEAAAHAPKKLDLETFGKIINSWAENYGKIDAEYDEYATIITTSQSSIFLPREVTAPLVPVSANTFREAISITGMDTVSLIKTPTTAGMNVPVITGSAGGLVAQNAGSETENTPTLTESITLDPATYQSGSVYYSNQLLAAGTIDINSTLPVLSYEKELGLESAIAAAIIADSGITQTVATSTTAAFTYDNLVDLNRSLPKRFDKNKVMLLSDAGYAYAEKLKGSDGQPILNRDAQNQELMRFNGTPVLRCSYLEAFGASKFVGVIISMIGFRLRDAGQLALARYDQVPAKPNQTGFNLFGYHAYGYAKSAVATLKTPAS